MLSELEYAAYYTYSPRGRSELSRKSRQLVGAIKSWDAGAARDLIARLAGDPAGECVREFFPAGAILVPAPRSTPIVAGGLWPALEICKVLVELGIGNGIARIVERVKPVTKSAFASPGNRPTIQAHYETLKAKTDLLTTGPFVIVDDFVTKGATLMAAARRIHEKVPKALVRGFALVRTMGFVPDVEAIVGPVVGMITTDLADEPWREP